MLEASGYEHVGKALAYGVDGGVELSAALGVATINWKYTSELVKVESYFFLNLHVHTVDVLRTVDGAQQTLKLLHVLPFVSDGEGKTKEERRKKKLILNR